MTGVGITFALLTLAIVALWFGDGTPRGGWRNVVWALPFVAACGAALRGGLLEPLGALWLAAMAAAVWWFAQLERSAGFQPAVGENAGWKPALRKPWQRIVVALAILALAGGLMTHTLPGFNNPLVLAGARFTDDAVPYRLHLNFDKTAAGIFLLAWLQPRLTRAAEWRAMLARAAPVAAALIAAILVLALASGYVRFAPKFPREAWLFLWANLFLTCMAEEALFRGFIQARLQRAWQRGRGGAWLALGVASVLFGFAHAAGGPTYVALSTVAGFGYGLAYWRAGNRIEASILTHFALNAAHFLAFTYPALARV